MNRLHEKKNSITWLQLLLPAVLAVLHIAAVSGRDRVTFHWPEQPAAYQYGVMILFVFFTWGFYGLLVRAVTLFIRREEKFLRFLKYFLGYFAFLSVFWILTWPGIFKGDEFYTIRAALNFQFSSMQSGLTSIFYILSLLFFPSMAAIVFFQLLLICTVFPL